MPSMVGYPITDKRKLKSAATRQIVAESRDKLYFGMEQRSQERTQTWKRSERQYKGQHWADVQSSDPTSDLVTINMSFSTVNTIMPYMTGSEPHFLVMPYSGDATPLNAKLQEAFLNRLWRSQEVAAQEDLESASVDFLIYGDGYLKAGYTIEDKRLDSGEYAEVAKIWVDHVDPWDVWIDPAADGIHNARWVAHRLRITRTELERDDRYSFVGEENVAYGDSTIVFERDTDRPEDSQIGLEVFDGTEFAVVYEFYDLINKRMIVFSEGELPLRYVEDIGGCPVVQMGNYRIPGSPYHMGELEQIYDMQMELNKTRSQMITHRRRNVQKFLAKKNVIGQDGITALRSDIVNDVVWVDGDQPLDSLIQAVVLQPLSADLYNVSDVMMRDIYEISGVNEYLRGATPEIRRTATEATIIEGASNIKSQYKLRQVEKLARRVGNLILAIAADIFPETDYDEVQLYLTGREAEMVNRLQLGTQLGGMIDGGAAPEEIMGAVQGAGLRQDAVLTPSPDIWKGSYEVEVEQSSTELRNPVLKEQKYREMAQMLIEMAPTLMQIGVPINIKKVLEEWFDAAGIDDVDAMFEPQGMMPPPGAPAEGGGGEVLPGSPNQAGVAPPTGMIDAGNTGAFPPQ